MSEEELGRLIEAHGAALCRALPVGCVYAIMVAQNGGGMHVYVEHDVAPDQIKEFLQEAIATLDGPDRIIGGH